MDRGDRNSVNEILWGRGGSSKRSGDPSAGIPISIHSPDHYQRKKVHGGNPTNPRSLGVVPKGIANQARTAMQTFEGGQTGQYLRDPHRTNIDLAKVAASNSSGSGNAYASSSTHQPGKYKHTLLRKMSNGEQTVPRAGNTRIPTARGAMNPENGHISVDSGSDDEIDAFASRPSHPSGTQAPTQKARNVAREGPGGSPLQSRNGEIVDDPILDSPGTSADARTRVQQEAPIIDLRKAKRMKPKSGKAAGSNGMPNARKPSTSTQKIFIPYSRVWWGAFCSGPASSNGDVPQYIAIRHAAPTLGLFRWSQYASPSGTPDYTIPFDGIKTVKHVTDEDQDPTILILVMREDAKVTGLDPSMSNRFQPAQRRDETLATIIVELNPNDARWNVGPQGELPATSDMYRDLVQRIKGHKSTPHMEGIRQNAANAILEKHKAAADQIQRDIEASLHGPPEASETSSASEKIASVAAASRKRPRSSSPERGSGLSRPRSLRRRSQRVIIDEPSPPPDPPVPVRPPVTNPHELVVVYPPTGVGSINITRGDYRRLDPGEYFNDTLIEFGLKYAIAQLREKNPGLADDIHIFNSFFYKKLSSKGASDGYPSVKKWTSKVNIFQKKYILIPINENFHWYLAIVYMPGLVLPPKEGVPAPVPADTRSSARISKRVSLSSQAELQETLVREFDRPPVSSASNRESPNPSDADSLKEIVRPASQLTLDGVVIDTPVKGRKRLASSSNAANYDMDIDPPPRTPKSSTAVHDLEDGEPIDISDDSPKTRRRSATGKAAPSPAAKAKVNDLEKTQIFMLDSLGVDHKEPRKILAQYLVQEAQDKKQIPEGSAEQSEMKAYFANHTAGKNVKVPVQPNHCDCGVYLIHFAETFLAKPDIMADEIINKNKKVTIQEKNALWNKQDVEIKRELMRGVIDSLAEDWQSRQPTARKKKDPESKSPESVVTPTAQVADPQATDPVAEPLAPHDIVDRIASLPPYEEHIVPPSPTRQSSGDREVEAMLTPNASPRGEHTPHPGDQRFPSPLLDQHENYPEDDAMDVDAQPYDPETTAASIMFPESTPPKNFSRVQIDVGSSSPIPVSPLQEPFAASYSYDTHHQSPPTMPPFTLEPRTEPLIASPQYPNEPGPSALAPSQPLSRQTYRTNGSVVVVSDSEGEDSSSPPRSAVSMQARKRNNPPAARRSESPELGGSVASSGYAQRDHPHSPPRSPLADKGRRKHILTDTEEDGPLGTGEVLPGGVNGNALGLLPVFGAGEGAGEGEGEGEGEDKANESDDSDIQIIEGPPKPAPTSKATPSAGRKPKPIFSAKGKEKETQKEKEKEKPDPQSKISRFFQPAASNSATPSPSTSTSKPTPTSTSGSKPILTSINQPSTSTPTSSRPSTPTTGSTSKLTAAEKRGAGKKGRGHKPDGVPDLFSSSPPAVFDPISEVHANVVKGKDAGHASRLR